MAIGDIFKVLLKGSIFGRPVINDFHYKQVTGIVTNSADLNSAFFTDILVPLLGITNVAVVYTEIDVYNLTVPTDFDENVLGTPQVGARTGDCLPPYATWSYKYVRTVLGLRAGRKGFAGVSESDQADGHATAPALVSLDGFGLTLSLTLASASASYEPGVYSTIFAGTPRVSPIFMQTTNVQYIRIGTQNSRKFGR